MPRGKAHLEQCHCLPSSPQSTLLKHSGFGEVQRLQEVWSGARLKGAGCAATGHIRRLSLVVFQGAGRTCLSSLATLSLAGTVGGGQSSVPLAKRVNNLEVVAVVPSKAGLAGTSFVHVCVVGSCTHFWGV